MDNPQFTASGTGRARGRSRGDRPASQPGGPPSAAARGRVAPGPSPAAMQQTAGEAQQAAPGGRGRSSGQKQMPPVEKLRPGPEPMVTLQPPPMQQARPGPFEESMLPQGPPAGRAAFRGPGAWRPGQGTNPVAAQIEGMSLAGGARKRGALAVQFLEPAFRAKTMEDKKGFTGEKCTVYANVFQMTETGAARIYQYHVDFNPEVPSKRLRIGMIKKHSEAFGDVHITDGMLLFLPKRLEKETTEIFVKRDLDGETIRITIKFTNTVETGSNTILQIYNLLYNKALHHIGLTMIQRNYFNPKLSVRVPQHKVEIWPGYVSAIGLYERSIGLVADVSHKIMSMQTAWDVISEAHRRARNRMELEEFATQALVGQIVLTRYNNKTYRIDDVAWNKTPVDKFSRRDGTEQSFLEYYKTAHAVTIKDPKQPLLVSLPKKRDQRAGQNQPICLVPELCAVTGLPDVVRNDFRSMQDIAKHTRLGPSERAGRLTALSEEIRQNDNARKEFGQWNVALAPSLTSFEGRVLEREKVKMVVPDNAPLNFDKNKVDWSREMRNAKMITSIQLNQGQWIFIFPQQCSELCGQVFHLLQRVGGPMGMRIGNPITISLHDISTGSYIKELKAAVKPDTQMVLILMKNSRKDMYDALKLLLCADYPVPSQCLLERTVRDERKRMSVLTKVAIQMNVKMGGEVWNLEIPIGNIMVVGIDTYHDSAQKRRSAVGMVASLNRNLTRYFTKCFLQSENEELGRGLNAGMTACLRRYHQVNGVLPEKIVVFRDGVGDGALDMVETYEIPQFTQSFSALQPDYNPGLTVVIVKKRMTMRLFAKDARGYCNPLPGTVVDDTITKPMWFDYYIVSQSVNQGTVAPTHYNVIRDGKFLKPEYLQRLTYKLCHLYYNWPGTIRVPAPCQYAHKVAFLVGQSLHREPHAQLCDTLFYL